LKKVLITGAAGFIGFHLSQKLIGQGNQVIGVDNLNDYYDVSLKQARLDQLSQHDTMFEFHRMDLSDNQGLQALFGRVKPDVVVNLAAQAGGR